MRNNQWDLLRHKGANEDKVFVGPYSTEIHITNTCALSCHFCPYHFSGDENYADVRKNIDFDVFQNIVDDSLAMKVELITLSGEGDPFSCPDICRMIAYVKNKNLKLDINTHALFPGKKIFPYAQLVDRLNINIPGVDEATYQASQFDKKNGFKQAVENVRLMAQEKKRPELNWVYVVTKDSFPYLSRVLLMAGELGFDRITFRLVIVVEDTEKTAIMGEDLRNLKKEIAAALRINAGKVKSNILRLANEVKSMIAYEECKKDMPDNSRSKKRRSIYFERIFPNNFSCLVGWHKAFIDLNGDVIFCSGNLQTVIGNAYKQSFQEIWNSPKANQMRSDMKYHFDLNKDFFRECRTCPYMSFNSKGEASRQMEWSKG